MARLSPVIRNYFRRIGAKGGRAGAGTPLRQQIAKRAAQKRWAEHRKGKQADYKIEWAGSTLEISPVLPKPLLGQLRYFGRWRRDGKLPGKWINLYSVIRGLAVQTHSGFLERIERYLTGSGATVEIARQEPSPLSRRHGTVRMPDKNEQKVVNWLLERKAGGTVVVPSESIEKILVSLVTALGVTYSIVVVPEIARVHQFYQALKPQVRRLRLSLGMLAGNEADEGDIVVTTAASLATRVIPPESVRLLVFVDPPRKGRIWLTELVAFGGSLKFALFQRERYPAAPPQRTILEALFGPVSVSVSSKSIAAVHRENVAESV